MVQRAYCATCHAPLEFNTDGNGRVIEEHPRRPCVPPPPFVHVPQMRRCQWCGDEFELDEGRGAWAAKSCSEECAEAIKQERRRQREQRSDAHGYRLRQYWLQRGRGK